MKNAYNAYRPINFNDGNIKINILREFFHQQCQWTSLFTTISLCFIAKFQIKFLFSEHFHFVSFGSSNFIGHKREFLFYFSGLFYCCWWCCCCFWCCFGRLFLSLYLSLFFSFRIFNLCCLIELIIFHVVSFVPTTETTTTTPPPNSNRSKSLAKECHYDHYLINEWPKSNIAGKLIQMIEIFKLQTHHNHHNVFLIPHKI